MAKFLNTSKAYAEIEDLVDKAKDKVVLISPYIKMPTPLFDRLKHVDRRNVKIVIVCRKGDLKEDVREDLRQLRNLELRFDENLHAKCFYNQESMVITSLNLLESSQRNNREMGILLSSKQDSIFAEALNEAEFIVANAERDSTIKNVLGGVVKGAISIIDAVTQEEAGYCIRCKTSIDYNADAPYCRDCYEVWAKYKNPDYEERYCHSCGKTYTSTKNKPLCNSCYRSR